MLPCQNAWNGNENNSVDLLCQSDTIAFLREEEGNEMDILFNIISL